MTTLRQYTIIPRTLDVSPESFSSVIRHVDAQLPALNVDKIDLPASVAVVTLPEEQAGKAEELLGEHYIMSPNAKLNLIE
jgi:hypothetical protein